MSCPHEEKHIELARLFVEIAQIDPMSAGSPWGILHSYLGSLDAFQYLIHQDHFMIFPQQRNTSGRTVLQHQIFHRMYYGASFERARLLLNMNDDLSSSIEQDPIYEGYTVLHCAASRWAVAKVNQDEHTVTQCELFLRKILKKANIHTVTKSLGFTPLTAVGHTLARRELSPSSASTVFSEWIQMINESGYDLSSYCQAEALFEEKRQKEDQLCSFDMIIHTGDKTSKPEISILPWKQRTIMPEPPWDDQSKICKSTPIGCKDYITTLAGLEFYVSKVNLVAGRLRLYMNLVNFLVIFLGAGIFFLFYYLR